MYTGIVGLLVTVSVIKGVVIAIGTLSFILMVTFAILAGIRHYAAAETGNSADEAAKAGHPYRRWWVFTLAMMMIFSGSVVVGNSYLLKTEWIMMRAAAPVLDAYTEANPESIYNPDQALSIVNDTALSILGSVQELPKLIGRISNGKSVTEVKKELEKEKRDKAFEEWYKNNKDTE